jgi:hypothetical protein
LNFFNPPKAATHYGGYISRRCLDQTLWNLVGIAYAMWSCAVKGWFFQNGCRCHGNGQNAEKLKNTKMFYIGSHFEMLAILKILKTKSTTLSDDLFLCQVSKGSTVRSEFNIFCTLVTMARQNLVSK